MEKAKIITSLECYFLFSVSSSVLTSLICVQILRGGWGWGEQMDVFSQVQSLSLVQPYSLV